MGRRVFVVGVGMTKFEKPGARDAEYVDLVKESVGEALTDAGISYPDVQHALVGYVYGDSTSGQRALYEVGMTGIPIQNVNNNCATGSSALYLGCKLVESGVADCVLAVGFEKMKPGSLGLVFPDQPNPIENHINVMGEIEGLHAAPFAAQLFGNAGREHMRLYGTTKEHLVKIAYKNHLHSTNNPRSQFQQKYTMEQIANSPVVHEPLTKLQCCPTSDGSAAAVIVSEEFLRKKMLDLKKAVEVLGIEMRTDTPSTFESKSLRRVVGYDMTKAAAEAVFQKTRKRPEDVQVVELHDCFSANELITYEALGLCPEGGAGSMIDRGDNTYGGKYVVNPSGGLISKGHPLGATGLAQCAELCWQLRGEAGKRQVRGAVLGLQHNIGLGGAVVVALYQLGFPDQTKAKMAVTKETDAEAFAANKVFTEIAKALEEEGEKYVKKIRGKFLFKVRKSDGKESYWLVNCKDGRGSVSFEKGPADCTLIMADPDLVDLMLGKINPQQAFFNGKLKVQGNLGLAMKLESLQKESASRLNSIRSKL